jgi:malonate-semialdehyde dehydrogenase (acetylating)/methylmalonate-semialdehyde dehydrogenase
MERIGHYIGGKHVAGESGRRGPVFDPATGEQTHEVDFADPAELNKAVDAAKEALPGWRATSLSKRTDIMFTIRELLEARKTDVAKTRSVRCNAAWRTSSTPRRSPIC